MSRITQKFSELKRQNRSGLITFTMAFDPDADTSLKILKSLPEAGADIVEFGIPFSDPMADGKTIQAAGLRALKAGATLKKILGLVAEFRKSNAQTPLVLMGYYNPVYRYGPEKFAREAVAAGVDGIIIVDLPPEEELECTEHFNKHKLALIRLIAPTSDARHAALLKQAQGFVYYISVTGITGAQAATAGALKEKVSRLKSQTSLPVAVGFGIKTPEQTKAAAQVADAVVVGSALVEAIAKGGEKEAIKFVASLKAALN